MPGLLRKSDIILMTASMVAGAPQTEDLLILVAPPRIQLTYEGGRLLCGRDSQLQGCPNGRSLSSNSENRGQGGREEEERPRILSRRSGARNRNRTAVSTFRNFSPEV